MDNGVQDVYTDPLFVGLTRPATMLGIPYTAFVFEFIGTTLVFLAIGNPIYLALAFPIHGVLYLISASDPAVFNAIFVWMKTIGRCRNSRFWGAASFAPLSAKKWVK
jgi:type IV secretion system protein VirB3